MEYVRLGSTGLKVSRVCLGCMSYGLPNESDPWILNEEQSRPYIQGALEAGINFFDTANVYSSGMSETVLGNALRDFARRDEVVIATKVRFPMGRGPNDYGLSRKHILSSMPHHLEDAIAALSVQLTPEEITRLEEPYRPHPIIAHS
ncbi:MAG TPA: aldo/keto reductase [Anaerolineales bacterium]|nr:aldo/keto reductase [Anaerolineales bacterium]